MKKTNKGFTLVELIIVIAVIGVLAAILIPVFANVIDKANLKSAYSDARNAIAIVVAEKTNGTNGGAVFGNPGHAWVKIDDKGGKAWYFEYANNGLVDANMTEAKGDTATNKAGFDAATGSTYTNTEIRELNTGITVKVNG